MDCAVDIDGEAPDVTGPYIQGRPSERFIYLSWVTVDDANNATLFRRAKLWLDDGVPRETLTPARPATDSLSGVCDSPMSRAIHSVLPCAHR